MNFRQRKNVIKCNNWTSSSSHPCHPCHRYQFLSSSLSHPRLLNLWKNWSLTEKNIFSAGIWTITLIFTYLVRWTSMQVSFIGKHITYETAVWSIFHKQKVLRLLNSSMQLFCWSLVFGIWAKSLKKMQNSRFGYFTIGIITEKVNLVFPSFGFFFDDSRPKWEATYACPN